MPQNKLIRGMRRLLGHALTPAEFQDCVIEEIRRRHPTAVVVRMGVDELSVDLPDGEGGVIHLERAYALHCAAPRNLSLLLGEVVSMLDPIEIAAADELVVLVRPFEFEAEADMLRRPIVGVLGAHVALDKPERYVFAPASELHENLKLDDEALWDRALRNTRDKLGVDPPPLIPEQILMMQTDDGLAASLLAFDDFWDSEELTAAGPLAVAAPLHTEVHAAPLSDAKSVARLRQVLAEADGPFFLTSDLFVRRDGRWEVAS
jgi:hypothetical protein